MFRVFFQIASNTFRENVREPVALLIVLTALCLIGIYPMFTLFTFREQIKLVVDSAMATGMVFGWVLAVIGATHAITREIDRGTAMAVLVKPVTRFSFILGKVAGIATVLTVFCYLTTVASLMSVRAAKDQFRYDHRTLLVYFGAIALTLIVGGIRNYISRTSFSMAALVSLVPLLTVGAVIAGFMPAEGGEALAYSWSLVPAFMLIWFSVLAMGILATALSTRLDLTANLSVCAAVFVLGLLSDALVQRVLPVGVAGVVHAALPNWQLFWTADALAAGHPIPLVYVIHGFLYLLCLAGLLLLLANWLFREREVGLQNVR